MGSLFLPGACGAGAELELPPPTPQTAHPAAEGARASPCKSSFSLSHLRQSVFPPCSLHFMFLTQKIKQLARKGREDVGERDVQRQSLVGLGWGDAVSPDWYPGRCRARGSLGDGCQDWGGGALQRELLFLMKYCLESTPPAPASPADGGCPPSLHPSLSQDARAAIVLVLTHPGG